VFVARIWIGFRNFYEGILVTWEYFDWIRYGILGDMAGNTLRFSGNFLKDLKCG